MKTAVSILASLTFFCSSAALAQGWVSSGGELSQDSKNPWFLNNTATVHYCIQIDRPGFSASLDDARVAITSAIQYWKTELSQPWSSWGGRAVSVLGRTDWVEVDCALGIEDLRFKLGHGTFDPEELQRIEDPLRFVGLSIRKQYDKVALKGKGIIFIASDRGASRYRDPSSRWITEAWSRGSGAPLLKYVLIHELGHVMGLPHGGVGVMSEVFFDQVMNAALAPIFWESPIEGTFSTSPHVESCAIPFEVRSYLGLQTADAVCVRLDISQGAATENVEWKVEWSPARGPRHWQRLGTVSQLHYELTDVRLTPAIQVRLTPEQTVFTGAERDRGYVTVAHWIEMSGAAVYRVEGSSAAKGVRFAMTPQSFELSAVVQGMPKPLLKWASLMSRKLSLAQMGESRP